MQDLLVATGNSHKTAEIRAILGAGYVVSDLKAHPELPEVEETGSTFLENATLKAVEISKQVEGLILSDDSGLEVDALGGEPLMTHRAADGEAPVRNHVWHERPTKGVGQKDKRHNHHGETQNAASSLKQQGDADHASDHVNRDGLPRSLSQVPIKDK